MERGKIILSLETQPHMARIENKMHQPREEENNRPNQHQCTAIPINVQQKRKIQKHIITKAHKRLTKDQNE